ncbi:hypothetical protein EUX98_g6054 [Antrodiella citrinella]|uniref:Rab-GAP TBC domain-containing protein n=1 Tax=Antrodiella citrinella TaxID=2447956 RepID=A0A4S4MPX6_9APHY|nr:hypothetical protein EUX98_g6054 [Antrodiella citrinella]
MDANELGRWTRFAGKGGIGKCVATQDCVAEASDDLMFLKDDEITVLMQLPGQDDLYLGYCEGVVGRFHGSFVRFQGRLKKPVMAKRSSTLPSSRPSSSLSTGTHGGRESRHSPSNPVPSPTSSSVVVLQRRVSDAAAHAAVTKPGTETVGPVQSSPLSPASIPPSADLAPTSPVLNHARTHSRGSASTASVYSPKMAATHQNDPPEMISLSSAFNDRVESPSDMEDDLDADESTTPDADSFRAPSQSPSPPPPQHIPQPKPLLDEPDPASASYMSSEPSARMSRISAMSDGEVGIGLTLLQNFMGGGDDSDSDSEEGERKSLYSDRDENENGVQDMSLVSDSTVEPLPEVEDDDEHEPNVADMSLDFPVPPEAPSPTSMHPSATDSEYGGGEEWEGASDIYDNYRYSRMSMASKMSRFSKASAFSLGVPPPVPTEGRPSMDSIRGMRERLGSSATTSSVDSALRSEQSKRVPAPLTFAPEITSSRNNSQDDQQQPQEAQQQAQGNTSPLLHTTFGSPLSSPTPLSTGGFVPTALASPIYATATNGAASLLRQRLEIERGSRPNSPPTEENPRGLGIMGLMSDTRARLSTQPIVMDDDESMPQITPPSNNTSFNSASMSMSMSPEQSNASMEPLSPPASRSNGMGSRDSTMSQSYLAEKQAMDSSFVIANPSPNPPPPYTPLSPTESSSSSFSHPPPPQTQPQPQPQPEPQSHPVGVPIARPRPAKPNANISPMARTSLFMPHPNAPKPAASPAGPMYGRPPSMDVNALLAGPPPGSVIHTLHAVLSMRYDGSPGSRRPTMYGMTEIDLSVAVGPVPIWFSVEPPQNVPAHRIKSPPAPTPLREGSPSLMQSASSSSQSSPQLGRPDRSRQGSDPGEVEGDARRVVPRANFFPKAPRPRSRSFSGFDSQIAEIELPKERVSLRSKLSLPTLRIRSEKQASTDIGSPRSPTSSVATSEQDQRTVQVNEAEFEMVMPSGSLSPIPSATEDGFGLPPPSPINPDHSLRTGSPTLSVTSSTSANTRLRVAPTPTGTQPSPSPSKPPASPATAEAYRKRELNWISIISSIPASQSRKSKKVRKLLQDGVPSSVRYLVWAHLTDSKAKRIDGLYARLGKRERVAASASIERDAAMFVERHPQLQDASLGNLLQAYMTMVPDTQYSSGLVAIAGLILLQSPEEDAFWTFISLMDSHLRPYFSANPIQMEVDAALLVKCLEANEAALSKKLFVDMGISPSTICRAWFTALFVDMLPPEHLRRVWDIFLSEGVVFLFRAGLAIFCCCKQALLDANSHDAVMAILLNPPASILPSHADAFIEVAFSLKMKDDDIRKLRNKMEAQVKRNTQSRIDVSRPSISLPRT